VILYFVYAQDKGRNLSPLVEPAVDVCRSEISVDQREHVPEPRFASIVDDCSNTFIAAANKEGNVGAVPKRGQVSACYLILDPEINFAAV
jgi:hypothetical protein